MNDLASKRDLIAEHEAAFAATLAARVIPQPQLSVWMILLPVIFVYYFMERSRYRAGSAQFREHYLTSRQRALEAACQAVETGTPPELDSLARASRLPESGLNAYHRFLVVLTSHYQSLLEAEGDTFEALVRSSYQTKINYLLFGNELGQAEKNLNQALEQNLSQTVDGYHNTVKRIEQVSGEIQRQQAEKIFG